MEMNEIIMNSICRSVSIETDVFLIRNSKEISDPYKFFEYKRHFYCIPH